jgi:hypothetical protein
MLVKQISVFLENKSGRLAGVANVLAGASVDIRAMSIADTTDFGILRLIVNDPEKALVVLSREGFAVSTTDVIAVGIPDSPGGLASLLNFFNEKNIDIEYLYAFITKYEDQAAVILKIDATGEAVKVLKDHGIKILKAKSVYNL